MRGLRKSMADGKEDVQTLKGTTILVNVEEALIDVLVVVFRYGKHVFQGALLDVNKKNCPLGINPFGPWESSPSFPLKEDPSSSILGVVGGATTCSNQSAAPSIKEECEDEDDRYRALKQRFTYFQHPPPSSGDGFPFHIAGCVVGNGTMGKNNRRALGAGAGGRGVRDQSVRMRRLRPRQVLCSQCKSICNENSENVQKLNDNKSNLRKNIEPIAATVTLPPIPKDTQQGVKVEPSTQIVSAPLERCRISTRSSDEYRLRPSCGVPGRMILRKRKPNDEDEDDTPSASDFVAKSSRVEDHQALVSPVSQPCPIAIDSREALSEEDDETENSNKSQRRPVIKISFANPQGQDTVVEIPARPVQLADIDASAKAAKKALKKAKKEAQRKADTLASSASPPSTTQTHYQGSSPSPLSEATSNSPGNIAINNIGSSPSTGGVVIALRRHKHHKHHKVKRKRRHRTFSEESSSGGGGVEDCGQQQDENRLVESGWGMVGNPFTVADIRPSDGLYEEVRNNCLRQKLSISLKRLSARAYARCSPRPHTSPTQYQPDPNNHYHHHHHHYHQQQQQQQEEFSVPPPQGGSNSESDSDEVPDFPRHEPQQHPQANQAKEAESSTVSSTTGKMSSSSGAESSRSTKPLMMRITTHSVGQCTLEGGREMIVGDIVWGKIHGFPWWPGKVLALSVSQRDTGLTISQQAHVSWFGSSTSSLMPCQQLSPFLIDFKSRYNRKKRGPYKEAIRQATLEAQQVNLEREEKASTTSTNTNVAANAELLIQQQQQQQQHSPDSESVLNLCPDHLNALNPIRINISANPATTGMGVMT